MIFRRIKMDSIINVVEGGGEQTVNARELHVALEVKRDFSTWITNRIEKYGFVEDEDYQIIVPKTGDYSGPGNPNFVAVDYLLTLGMAKELAIVENNEKGRQVRKYLIALEKAWNSPEAVARRSMQLAGSVLRRRADIVRMLDKSADFMKVQIPGYKGRKKAGEYLAAAVMQYESAVHCLLLISDEMVTKYDALLIKAAFLEQHIGITDEKATDMLFATRAKLGNRWYEALGGEEEANLMRDDDMFKWPEPLLYKDSDMPVLPDLSGLSGKVLDFKPQKIVGA
jgi:phage anti-repressor protein